MAPPAAPSPMLARQLQHALHEREKQGRCRRLVGDDAHEAARLAQLTDFSSNDYVSAARDTRVRRAWLARLESVPLGSTGSRLLDGDSPLHTRTEQRLAEFFGAPAALLCNTGFDANVSLLATIPQRGDVIVYDELVHASMHDGMRKSRAAQCVPFAHNDARALERVLHELGSLHAANVFLAVESVYSMDGTVCALRELADVLHAHAPHAHIFVDEAHGAGVYGTRGRGVCEALGCTSLVSARLVTFGKAFGCAGAVLLVPPLWRTYLLNYARPIIYSTALPPAQVAAIDEVLAAFARGDMDDARHDLHARVAQLYDILGRARTPGRTPGRPSSLPPAPIVPVRTRHAKALAAHLQAAGFLVRAVCYPTVPRDQERVRICVHAHNTPDDVARLGHALLSAPHASVL